MATFKIFRETTLPGTLQPYAMYVVAPASKPDYIELYVTNAAGTATRRLLTQADIQGLIDASLTAISQIQIVANIAARDALAPTTTLYVYVQDATGDATVASGGATYLYNVAGAAWVKISEAETMDVSLNWAALVGRPSSAVADIDDAVAKRHTHANKTELDKIGEAGGELTYNGAQVKTEWGSTGW